MSDWMDFREYARTKVIKKTDRILEFGPLNWPMVKKSDHPNTYYADIRNSDDIKKLYTGNDYLESTGIRIDIDTIVDIDYVIKGTYKDSFKGVEKFDVIVMSHVIEHIPDIVNFFQEVTGLLKKNGKLVIIYPDVRYCFDHFRNGTTFVDAYSAYVEKRMNYSAVFDFVNNVVHENDPKYFWNDKSQNDILPTTDFSKTIQAYKNAKKDELPDDVHFWPFADYQFVKFLYDLDRAQLSAFEIDEFYETQENTQEFMTILRVKKNKTIDRKKYSSLLNKLNPVSKEIEHRHQNIKLSDDIQKLKLEYARLLNELSAVYSSKRWRYTAKLAEVKHRILRGWTND
ncbi:MAG: methyltransferase domain-containing protein [Candidatus Microsaccharimonas sp.]